MVPNLFLRKYLWSEDPAFLVKAIFVTSLLAIVASASQFVVSGMADNLYFSGLTGRYATTLFASKNDIVTVLCSIAPNANHPFLRQAYEHYYEMVTFGSKSPSDDELAKVTDCESYYKLTDLSKLDIGNESINDTFIQSSLLIPWKNRLFSIIIGLQLVNATYAVRLFYVERKSRKAIIAMNKLTR